MSCFVLIGADKFSSVAIWQTPKEASFERRYSAIGRPFRWWSSGKAGPARVAQSGGRYWCRLHGARPGGELRQGFVPRLPSLVTFASLGYAVRAASHLFPTDFKYASISPLSRSPSGDSGNPFSINTSVIVIFRACGVPASLNTA